jgi:hypothetical protein
MLTSVHYSIQAELYEYCIIYKYGEPEYPNCCMMSRECDGDSCDVGDRTISHAKSSNQVCNLVKISILHTIPTYFPLYNIVAPESVSGDVYWAGRLSRLSHPACRSRWTNMH